MKKLALMMMFACGQTVVAQQTAENMPPQELAKAVDVLIAAYQGAQAELAKQNGGNAAVLSEADKRQIQQEAGQAIQTLQNFTGKLRQGQLSQSADDLLALQQQLNRVTGQAAEQGGQGLAQAAEYLRRGGDIYQRWQQQTRVSDITQANAAQVESLLTAVEQELAAGTAQEREVSKMVGGVHGLLKLFSAIENSPEPYAAERQALSREVANLQALAEQQGIGTSQHQQAAGLLQMLKLRFAEHQIGMIDPQADKQLLFSLQSLLKQPRAIFSKQEFAAAERLLLQLGVEFAEVHRLFVAQEKLLLKQ